MVVNGQGQPKLIITDVSHPVGNPLAAVTLPYCKRLIEHFEPLYVTHRVQGGLLADGRGVQYECTLDYSDYLDGQVLLQIAAAFRIASGPSGPATALILVPRIDLPERQYRVKFKEGFSMAALLPDIGHEMIVFHFEGLDIEPDIPMYGDGYGTHYGGYAGDGSETLGYGYEL